MSIDPTRVELTFDPLTERMIGTAIHGDTPFDVPYVSQIDGNLWTGGCANGLVLPEMIEHVVSLYVWERYTVRHELRSALQIRMHDSLDQETSMIVGLASWVNCCAEDGPTLVHCQAGLNRSALVACTALVISGRYTPTEAIDLMREKRSPAVLCNWAFEEWVKGLGHE